MFQYTYETAHVGCSSQKECMRLWAPQALWMRRILSRSSSTEKLCPFGRLFTIADGQHGDGSSEALLPPSLIQYVGDRRQRQEKDR